MSTNGIDFTNFSISNEAPADSCSICCESDMRDGLEHRVSTTAVHRFHTDCATPWLQQHKNCPLCRKKVTSINGVALENNSRELPVYTIYTIPLSIVEAATIGDIEAVRRLDIPNLSEQDRGLAVVFAAGGGHLNIVLEMLANGTISEFNRRWAVSKAAYHGYADIVNTLLTNDTNADQNRGVAVYRAAKGGHADLVNALLANGTISDEYRGVAVSGAAKRGHANIVNTLLTDHTIPLKNRLKAMASAIKARRIDIVTTLVPQNLRHQLASAAPALATAAAAAMMGYFYYNTQASEEGQ